MTYYYSKCGLKLKKKILLEGHNYTDQWEMCFILTILFFKKIYFQNLRYCVPRAYCSSISVLFGFCTVVSSLCTKHWYTIIRSDRSTILIKSWQKKSLCHFFSRESYGLLLLSNSLRRVFRNVWNYYRYISLLDRFSWKKNVQVGLEKVFLHEHNAPVHSPAV